MFVVAATPGIRQTCNHVTWKTFCTLGQTVLFHQQQQLSGLNPPSSFSFSSRTKLSDGCRRMSSLAVARPTMPPPTTATSYVLEEKVKRQTGQTTADGR